MSNQNYYNQEHTSALNKISSRLPEALEFINSFNTDFTVSKNSQYAYSNRWYGNTSELKCKELTRHFNKRFIITPENFKLLRLYIQKTSGEDFACLNHFYMLLNDKYYRWATASFISCRYQKGLLDIPKSIFDQELKQHLPSTVGDGSLSRYGSNLLTAIRDNGLLKGRKKKTIISPSLSAKTMGFMLYSLLDFGAGSNEFDNSPLFLSILKPRELLVPLFYEGEHSSYWEFTGDREKISVNLNFTGLKNWLEECI